MSNSSFTKQISWRPFYLALIIFLLQVISDADANRFGDACTTSNDCTETQYCNKKQVCDCPNFLRRNIVQFFDEESRSCVSTVGKGCTLDEGPLPFNCVPNAICEPQEKGPSNWGTCECKEDYKEDYRHLCVPDIKENEESGPVSSSMEEVLKVYPIGSQGMTALNTMGKPQKLDDDGNKNIVVDQEVLDQFPSGAGGLGLMTKFIVFLLTFVVFTM